MHAASITCTVFFVAMVNLMGCPADGDPEEANFDSVALPSGETCPQGCWVEPGHPGLACGACEDGWCHKPLSSWEFPYCTSQCDDDADCAVHGEEWVCLRRTCVENGRH